MNHCLLAEGTNNSYTTNLKDIPQRKPMDGEVLVEVHYSSVNYKDALAVTGKGKILRKIPLIPGIDFSGVIAESKSSKWKPGTSVIVTGCGYGEDFDGGFSTHAIASENHIVQLPSGLSHREAMILGTAGFTAALALMRMEQNAQTPAMGPVVVTGASGGVGMIALDILRKAGYQTVAVSGKKDQHPLLKEIGATTTCTPEELKLGARPLESVRWGGAIDNVGGETLAGILKHVQLWGNVASIGLAEGANLSTTVMPFILRGVSLLGASSNNCPMNMRHEIWRKLSTDWKPNLEKIFHKEIGLSETSAFCEEMLNRKSFGRTIVNVKR